MKTLPIAGEIYSFRDKAEKVFCAAAANSGRPAPNGLVVEQDESNGRSLMEAVTLSRDYLKPQGW